MCVAVYANARVASIECMHMYSVHMYSVQISMLQEVLYRGGRLRNSAGHGIGHTEHTFPLEGLPRIPFCALALKMMEALKSR